MAMATGSVQGHSARFAAACDVLSRYVKAAAVEARPAASTVGAVLPLMPGADLSMHQEEPEAGPAPAPAPAPSAPQQLIISYGGRVVVLDDVPADRAAELLRLAAAAQAGAPPRVLPAKDDLLPMARKASLRQFMEKRKGRVAARGSPYSRPHSGAAAVSLPPDHLTLKL